MRSHCQRILGVKERERERERERENMEERIRRGEWREALKSNASLFLYLD
jgi:hypothetical protein